MQNDLEEFYAMVDFANPGLLGAPNHFRKTFQNPILAGRMGDVLVEAGTWCLGFEGVWEISSRVKRVQGVKSMVKTFNVLAWMLVGEVKLEERS
jgi:hypothetical protein